MTTIGMVLLFSGVLTTLIGVIGLYRFPDTYTRIKALALVGFPGAVLIHSASSLLLPSSPGAYRGWITAFLFFVSGPVLNHVLMLAAHRSGVKRNYHLDDLGDKRVSAARPDDPDGRPPPPSTD